MIEVEFTNLHRNRDFDSHLTIITNDILENRFKNIEGKNIIEELYANSITHALCNNIINSCDISNQNGDMVDQSIFNAIRSISEELYNDILVAISSITKGYDNKLKFEYMNKVVSAFQVDEDDGK